MSNNFNDDPDLSNHQHDYDKDLATGSKAQENSKIHKRIDEILEEKRLKKLLGEDDDWLL